MRFCSFLQWALCLIPILSSHAAEPSASPSESVFFAFDDQNIAWQHHLKLTLVTPEKHPANPVVRCGPTASPGRSRNWDSSISAGTRKTTSASLRERSSR